MQDAHLRVVVPQGSLPETRRERVVIAPSGFEKPAAHPVEDRSQGIQRLLDAAELAQGPVEADGSLGRGRRLHERPDQLERLSRRIQEPISHEAQVLRPVEALGGMQRRGEALPQRGQLLGQARGQRRVELPLDPIHPLEGPEERPEQGGDSFEELRIDRHGFPPWTALSKTRT